MSTVCYDYRVCRSCGQAEYIGSTRTLSSLQLQDALAAQKGTDTRDVKQPATHHARAVAWVATCVSCPKVKQDVTQEDRKSVV